MTQDSIAWLMQWYLSQCNGEWEHSYGIKIDNLDNPGWTLQVDLQDTNLENRPFKRLESGEPADNLEEWQKKGSWWVAEVKDGRFKGGCGPLDLPALINVFRSWAEA